VSDEPGKQESLGTNLKRNQAKETVLMNGGKDNIATDEYEGTEQQLLASERCSHA
jgi:hypothetical protein